MMEQSFQPQPNLFGFEDAAGYPDVPGHRDVDTSTEAAEAIGPHLARLQRQALEAITAASSHGLTANELAATTGLPRETVQPRTSELRKKGLITDSGKRRPNPNGKRAIVWVVPEHRGQAAIEAKHG